MRIPCVIRDVCDDDDDDDDDDGNDDNFLLCVVLYIFKDKEDDRQC